jgi:hypothetical protein
VDSFKENSHPPLGRVKAVCRGIGEPTVLNGPIRVQSGDRLHPIGNAAIVIFPTKWLYNVLGGNSEVTHGKQ